MQDPQQIVTLSVVAKEDLYLDESKESLRFPKGILLHTDKEFFCGRGFNRWLSDTGHTCLFAIKKKTPLGRLKKSFCSKFNLFLCDGNRNKVYEKKGSQFALTQNYHRTTG
jgi:hypothetical protein